MATNLVYRNTDAENRVETLAATYGPGAPVTSLAGLPAVTVTASGDHTTTDSTSYPPYTISGIPDGGAGLEGKQVTLAFDGTWEFLATGFDGTAPNPAVIAQGTAIQFKASNAKLTTAAVTTGITAWGYVDFPPDYDKTRGYVPVRIGA
jgi:hypothetical protein